jgi:hypothetical protein
MSSRCKVHPCPRHVVAAKGLHAAAAAEGLHVAVAEGLHVAAAAEGLHAAIAEGLHVVVAAEGLHVAVHEGLHVVVAEGLHEKLYDATTEEVGETLERPQ